jgi:predicted RND superfamily exporter protein
MKCNVGKAEKIIRILFGAIIILLGVYFKSWWGIVGLIPIITGLCGNCPLYTLFGISTCKIDKKNQ